MRRVASACLVVVLCGCLGGKSTPSTTHFVMTDLGSASESVGAAAVARNLVVSGSAVDAFYDAENLVYSREAGSRGYYQFAAWTDRPSRLVSALVQHRLETRGRFTSVSSITAGVDADLLLNVNMTQMYHDLSVNPAVARVQLIGELVNWKKRALLGRRSFTVAAPVARPDASAAVDAMNHGVTLILDELVPWVEATAGGP